MGSAAFRFHKKIRGSFRGFIRLFFAFEVFAGFLINNFHRQAHLAAIIKTDEFDLHRVTFGHHIGGIGDALVFQLRDMHQPVALTEKVHKRAKVHDLDDRAFVNHANFRFGHNRIDEIKRGLDGLAIAGGNFDEPVIANINLGAGGLNNLAHHLAARADNFADFILRHLNGLDFRSVFTHFITGFGERFAHFTQNMRAAALCLV